MPDADSPDVPRVAHLRLPASLHSELVVFAKETRRSLNGAAVYLLERALQQEEQGQPR